MSQTAHTPRTSPHLHSQTDPRMHEESGPLVMASGDGAYVVDEAGNRYLEAVGGLWCASLGFNDRRLADAAHRQMSTLATYHTFSHRSNRPCIELAARIAELVPIADARVFFTNSGSEANDTMVKLAWYYNVARGKPHKRKIISRLGAFHGSTIMGAALGALPHMHRSFNLPDMGVVYTEPPCHYRHAQPGESEEAYASRLAAALEALILKEGPDTIAAMIAEPVIGGGGVLVPPASYFPKIRAVLSRHDILLLSDEVICGFGRTGSWFGSQTFGFVPDMMSMAKGLSSGYLPIAAVAISDAMYQVIADEAHRIGVFGHGFTYSGHPVTSAVALEALRIYTEMDLPARAGRLGEQLRLSLSNEIADHPLVGDVRGVGLIAGIELAADKASRTPFDAALKLGAAVEQQCRRHGVMIRNMGDTLAICPPYVIEAQQIDELVTGLRRSLDAVAADRSRLA
jgi:4-aminobutyrate--pyruvate transaminase